MNEHELRWWSNPRCTHLGFEPLAYSGTWCRGVVRMMALHLKVCQATGHHAPSGKYHSEV